MSEARSDTASTQPNGIASPSPVVLEVKGLRIRFRTVAGYVHAANGVNLEVRARETLAVVGESGSGKTVTAQAVMGILDSPPGEITAGEIVYRDTDILQLSSRDRRQLQGRHIAMVFQDAMTALNPRFTVGYQIGEMFRVHQGLSWKESKAKAIDLLDRVQIPSARERLNDYPYQLSGGMKQRVMIAIAISLDPAVLIADEPTTALDVTIQARIMSLLADLQRDTGLSLVLITHDLGVVGGVADRVAVMYAGRVVESGELDSVYGRPAHPYTRALLLSAPDLDTTGQRLSVIPGSPPDLADLPSGCPFHPRCTFRGDICEDVDPAFEMLEEERGCACHFSGVVLDAK